MGILRQSESEKPLWILISRLGCCSCLFMYPPNNVDYSSRQNCGTTVHLKHAVNEHDSGHKVDLSSVLFKAFSVWLEGLQHL